MVPPRTSVREHGSSELALLWGRGFLGKGQPCLQPHLSSHASLDPHSSLCKSDGEPYRLKSPASARNEKTLYRTCGPTATAHE